MGSPLVTDPQAKPVYSSRAETDARRALTRGLAEYALSLETVGPGGRPLKLVRTFDDWAEVDDKAEYPSGIAFTPERGTYDADRFTPSPGIDLQTPEGLWLVGLSELSIPIHFQVIATDVDERTALVKMLEEAFAPVEWMYGMRLDLPHYYGRRGVYAPIDIAYDDNPESALQGLRIAEFTLAASVIVTRVKGFVRGIPKVETTVT